MSYQGTSGSPYYVYGSYNTPYQNPRYFTPWSAPQQVQTPTLQSPAYAPTSVPLPAIPSIAPTQYNGPVEAVTVPATRSPYQVQTPSFNSPVYSPTYLTPPALSPGAFLSPANSDNSLPVEAVTVEGSRSPYQVRTPTLTPFYNYATPFTPAYYPLPAFSNGSPQSPGVEAVTVEGTRSPQARTPTLTPNFNNVIPFTPAYFPLPAISPYTAPGPRRRGQQSGGGGGGSSGGAKPQPQQPPPAQQQQLPIRPSVQQPTPGVTAQQKAQLAAMTPAQLQALLQNPDLTPAQRAAVQNALNQKQAALKQQLTAARAGGGTSVPGNQTKQTTTPSAAAPVTPISFVVPLLVAAGVATAWQITHHKKFQAGARRLRRRIMGA